MRFRPGRWSIAVPVVALTAACSTAPASPNGTASGAAAADLPPSRSAAPSAGHPTSEPSAQSPAPGHVSLCAQLPGRPTAPPEDLEGFFNATPADADGNVIEDPSAWGDPRLSEHPRVALVDTDTGVVVTTYDRVSCTLDDPTWVPPARDPQWPQNAVAIIDMDSQVLISIHEFG